MPGKSTATPSQRMLKRLLYPTYISLSKGIGKRAIHWITHGHFSRRTRINHYLRKTSNRFLQVGGGRYRLKNWLNGDIIDGDIYLNARRRLPFPDACLDRVFAEHFIEHIKFNDAEYFLTELNRVLRPGARIRFATPDLEKIVEIYEDRNPHVSLKDAMDRHAVNHRRQVPSRTHFVNDIFRLWGHQFIYDFETLKQTLEKAGFTEVKRQTFGESCDPFLKNLERHADVEWMKVGFQLIVEGIKPKAANKNTHTGNSYE